MVILTVFHSLGAALKTLGLKLAQLKKSSSSWPSSSLTSPWSLTLNLYTPTFSRSVSLLPFLTRSSVVTLVPGLVDTEIGSGDVTRLKGPSAAWARGGVVMEARTSKVNNIFTILMIYPALLVV